MRLFIGTLYTGENGFDECIRSIQEQAYQNIEHFVFRNLPNKGAHIALFQSFLERSNEFDLLVKVDADMVLTNPSLFENIVHKMEANPSVEILTIAVHDFFSDRLIYGLNAYRNSVRWDFSKENLFVDIPDTPRERYLFDNTELAPAATHCANPSPFQAFHYGVHRGLKVIQPAQAEKRESSSRTHWNSLELTWAHFLKTKDTRLGLACLGAELGYTGFFSISDLDFSNPKIGKVLENFLHFDAKSMKEKIIRLRNLNFGFLPAERRRKVLCSPLGKIWMQLWIKAYPRVRL